jgi:hypothetical protein
MGLRRLPALLLKREESDDQDQILFDNVEDIVSFLEVLFYNHNTISNKSQLTRINILFCLF